MQGDLVGRWGIGLEDAVGLPFCLNLLLPGDKGVSFLGLHRVCELEDQYMRGRETYTLELLRLGDGHDNVWSRHGGWLLLLAALVTRYLGEDSQCQMYILSVPDIDSPPFVCGGLLVVCNARLRVCSRSKLSHAGR